jgi:hypothetical protein
MKPYVKYGFYTAWTVGQIFLEAGLFVSLPLFYRCPIFFFICLLSVLYSPDTDSVAKQAIERSMWRNVTFTPWSSFVSENEYMVYNKSYDNTVHLLLESSWIPTCFGGDHHHHQGRHHHRPNNSAARGVSLVLHPSLYFASSLNTQLFMSHLPRMVCGVVCPYNGGGRHWKLSEFSLTV